MLKDEDANELMDRIKGLRNKNVRKFALFLAKHFMLSYGLGGDFKDRFEGDGNTLRVLKELVEKEIENTSGIRMWAFQYLEKVIGGCIRRCNGEREVLSKCM